MKTLLLTCSLLLVATAAQAQTPTVHAANVFGWDQAAPTLAAVNAYAFTPKEGTTVLAALTGVVCTGAASPFACSANIGARPAGAHTYTLIAIDTSTLTPLESVASNPVSFTFRGPLVPPANFGVR